MTTGRTAQLLLDHLLALSMNAHGGRQGRFVVLYPATNTAVKKYIASYRGYLVDGDATFHELTLERTVECLRPVIDHQWLDEFTRRYLDIAALDRLDGADG